MTRKEQNRRLIIETAKGMFIEKGFKESSMVELATIANIGRKTVYRHFENKDLLLIAIITELFELFNDRITKVVYDQELNTFQRIEYLFTVYSEFFLANIDMLKLIGMMDINIGDDSRSTDIYKRFISETQVPDTILLKNLRDGLQDGSIREDINIEVIAVTLNNALLSLASRAISHRDQLDSEQGLESWNMVITLSELLLTGIKSD